MFKPLANVDPKGIGRSGAIVWNYFFTIETGPIRSPRRRVVFSVTKSTPDFVRQISDSQPALALRGHNWRVRIFGRSLFGGT